MEQAYIRMTMIERHKMKMLGTVLLTAVLMGIAGVSGIGYNSTVEITPVGLTATAGLTEGSASIFRLWQGSAEVSFNPILYPLSYLFGSGSTSKSFIRSSERWDYYGNEVAESVVIYTVLVEWIKHIPYFVAVGGLTIILAAKFKLRLAHSRKPANISMSSATL